MDSERNWAYLKEVRLDLLEDENMELRGENERLRKEIQELQDKLLDIELVNIGELRRTLFTAYDSRWNGWVRDKSAELENPGGWVDVHEMMQAVVKFAQQQTFALEMIRNFAPEQSNG